MLLISERLEKVRPEGRRRRVAQGGSGELTRYDGEGWRATFFPEGRTHSLTAAVGSAWEREPWTAVQRAVWKGLRKRKTKAA